MGSCLIPHYSGLSIDLELWGSVLQNCLRGQHEQDSVTASQSQAQTFRYHHAVASSISVVHLPIVGGHLSCRVLYILPGPFQNPVSNQSLNFIQASHHDINDTTVRTLPIKYSSGNTKNGTMVKSNEILAKLIPTASDNAFSLEVWHE
jgi:hypothetical protein